MHRYQLAAELNFYFHDKRVESPGHPAVYMPESQSLDTQFSFWPRYDQVVLTEASARPPGEKPPRNFGLTKREMDILTTIVAGLSNKEIGQRLGISEGSVKAVLQQLFARTGVRTRSQLVRIAVERHSHDWLSEE